MGLHYFSLEIGPDRTLTVGSQEPKGLLFVLTLTVDKSCFVQESFLCVSAEIGLSTFYLEEKMACPKHSDRWDTDTHSRQMLKTALSSLTLAVPMLTSFKNLKRLSLSTVNSEISSLAQTHASSKPRQTKQSSR